MKNKPGKPEVPTLWAIIAEARRKRMQIQVGERDSLGLYIVAAAMQEMGK